MKFSIMAAVAALGLSFASAPALADGGRLEAVKERGSLKCSGHNGSFLGFAEFDDQGT